jgi:hypothetical protein
MNTYQKAVKHYGGDNTIYKAVEAQSRLTLGLMRHENGENNVDEIAESIATVQVMLEQLKELFNVHSVVREHVGRKINRLERNIKDAKWRE